MDFKYIGESRMAAETNFDPHVYGVCHHFTNEKLTNSAKSS